MTPVDLVAVLAIACQIFGTILSLVLIRRAWRRTPRGEKVLVSGGGDMGFAEYLPRNVAFGFSAFATIAIQLFFAWVALGHFRILGFEIWLAAVGLLSPVSTRFWLDRVLADRVRRTPFRLDLK